MKRYHLVECVWLDAVTMDPSDWVPRNKVRNKPMPTRTCGYLVAETEDAVTICAIVNRDHVALGVTIPRRMIDELHYLKRRKP